MSLYTPKLIEKLRQAVLQLAPSWGVAGVGCAVTFLTVSENATFILVNNGQRYIIRAYRPFYHDDQEILSELHWMQALEQTAIVPLPHVFCSHDDALFLTMDIEGMRWRFAAFTMLMGEAPQVGHDLVHWFSRLGEISARLHEQSKAWPLPEGFRRKHWHFDTMIGKTAYWGDWRQARGLSVKDHAILEECTKKLQTVSAGFIRDQANFGLIHGDLRLANLLLHDGQLSVIDFDDCGFSYYMTDLANAVSFIEHEPIVPKLFDAWCEGYAKVQSLPATMVAQLPHLVMMRRIQLTAWLASHHEIPTAHLLGDAFHQDTVRLARNYLEKATVIPAQ